MEKAFNKKNMRIAFVTQPWDGIGSGSSLGILTCNLIQKLVPGNKVYIFCKNGKCNIESENITYLYENYKLDILFAKYLKFYEKAAPWKNSKNPYFSSTFYYFLYAIFISLKIKSLKIEIVHIHNFSQFVKIVRLFNPKTKIVLHMHCEWLTQISAKTTINRINSTDKVVGCSEYIKNTIIDKFPEFSSKIVAVPNATNKKSQTDSTPVNPIKRILFVGRISPEKGVHILISTFNKVVKEFPGVQLDLVGAIKSVPKEIIIKLDNNPLVKELEKFYNNKSYYEQLVEMISEEALNKIKFHNHVEQNKLEDYYRNADILVNPSLSESFGMALIEANSFGVPVIVTKTGGMNELVIDGQNGFKIDPSEIEMFSKKILLLLKNDELRNEMGEKGVSIVNAKYNWDTISEKFEKLYKSLRDTEI